MEQSFERVVSIDIGTSKIKVVKYKDGVYYYEKEARSSIQSILSRAIQKDYDAFLVTGSGASSITSETYDIQGQKIPIYRMDELDCCGSVIPREGHGQGLVVNIGTGTSFVYYDQGKISHVAGTGLGGGTFEGLGKRLLMENDPIILENWAKEGKAEHVDLVMKDIYDQDIGWLQENITVANFSKDGLQKEDVALAIHRLVMEPILSMVKGIYFFKTIQPIYFVGGVMNNEAMQAIVKYYMEFFDIPFVCLEKPSYATALGALFRFNERYGQTKGDK